MTRSLSRRNSSAARSLSTRSGSPARARSTSACTATTDDSLPLWPSATTSISRLVSVTAATTSSLGSV